MLARHAPLALLSLLALACSAGNEDGSTPSGSSGPGGPGATTGSGFGGGSTGSSGFDGEECASNTFANAVPASVLVVLDRSGSMSGGDGQPDKWAPTKNALKQMMQSADQELRFGLSPFPKGDFNWDFGSQLTCAQNPSSPTCAAQYADGGCEDVHTTPVVAVAPLSSSAAPISAWLDGNGPNGGTPTLWALKAAYEHMRSVDAQGERYVLLITDGEPNQYTPAQSIGPISFPEMNLECKTLAEIEAETLAASSGSPVVKTFVIGSPGSEGAASSLSQLAVNGLTAPDGCTASSGQCHFRIGSANFQADLQAVLDEIAGAISECVFALPSGEDVDPGKVNVKVETESGELEVFRDPAHQDGWDYTDGSQTKIELYGPACEAYKASKGNEIVIVLGCVTVVK